MSVVTIYIDYLSQPARAVHSFCLINDIPHIVQEVNIMTGQTSTKEFEQISPMKTVPAMSHNGLILFESSAIMIYLAQAFNVPDHWYPKDPVKQAPVNVYLHWHHLHTRYGCGHYLYRKIVRPLMDNLPFSKELEQEMLFVQKKSLRYLEKTLENDKFAAGTLEPSIADLSCFFEIGNLQLINFDFSQYPNLHKWFRRMERIPGISQANLHFNKFKGDLKL